MTDRTTPAGGTSALRLGGIDAFRYLLCFPVAVLHVVPEQPGTAPQDWVHFTTAACRSAVPFFFIASGFFLRDPVNAPMTLALRPIRRIMPVYLAWFVIYAAIGTVAMHRPLQLSPRDLATGGIALHLWFLPVLVMAQMAAFVGIKLVGDRLVTAMAVLVALTGVLFGDFHDAFGLPRLAAVRATVAPLFIMIGYWLSRTQRRISVAAAAMLVATSCAFGAYNQDLVPFAGLAAFTALAGSLIFGTATFLLACSLDGKRWLSGPTRLGPIALGVYALHLLMLWLVTPVLGNATLMQVLAAAALAVGLASAGAWLLDRTSPTRWLVR